MNENELKENRCTPFFHCAYPQQECVYYSPKENGKCKYGETFCNSLVAKGNKMIIELKKMEINING